MTKRGCLMIHGLTETPVCLGPLPERLQAAGFIVRTPKVSGHGRKPRDLARTSWQEWYASVRAAYEELRRSADDVSCVGLSLGALLCLKLALDEGPGIRAMALLATPIHLRPIARRLATIFRHSPLRWIFPRIPKDWTKSAADPEGRRIYRANSFWCIPTASVFQVIDLQEELRPRLGEIRTPALIIHGAGDQVTPPMNLEVLRNQLGSETVEALMLPRSRHVITLDYEKDLIAERIMGFFARMTARDIPRA